jgi:hypothetical protein
MLSIKRDPSSVQKEDTGNERKVGCQKVSADYQGKYKDQKEEM